MYTGSSRTSYRDCRKAVRSMSCATVIFELKFGIFETSPSATCSFG